MHRGVTVASGIGIQRSMYCSMDTYMICTPVDQCVRGLITGIWKKVFIDERSLHLKYDVKLF